MATFELNIIVDKQLVATKSCTNISLSLATIRQMHLLAHTKMSDLGLKPVRSKWLTDSALTYWAYRAK